jgi:hypothetical protein
MKSNKQQRHELTRPLQLKLPGRDAHEKTGQHRLADIHRIESPTHIRVEQPGPDSNPNGGLKLTHQRGRGIGITSAHAADQVLERCIHQVATAKF